MSAASSPDYEQLLGDALRRSGCETGTLHLLEGALLHLKAQCGLPAHVAEIVRQVPLGKGMAGLAAERREPVQTCNLQSDASSDIRPGAKAVPVQASVALPMLQGGELKGVLGLARAQSHEWSAEEIAQMLSLASGLAAQLP